jgi:hypothetical protein
VLSEVALAALRCGGTLHLVQLPATLLLARHARAARAADALPGLLRRVLGVLAGGIVLLVFGGFVLCWAMPAPVLNEAFGVMFAAGWAAFWFYRLLVQCFVYGPWVNTRHRCAAGTSTVEGSR